MIRSISNPPQLRALRAIVLLAALAVTGACRGGTDVDDEPDINAITLAIGGEQVITISGNVTTEMVLPVGTTTVSAVVTDRNGASIPHGNDLRLDVTIPANPSGIQFERTGPYSGNFTAAIPNSTPVNLRFSVFSTSHGHAEFGPFTVPTIVQ